MWGLTEFQNLQSCSLDSRNPFQKTISSELILSHRTVTGAFSRFEEYWVLSLPDKQIAVKDLIYVTLRLDGHWAPLTSCFDECVTKNARYLDQIDATLWKNQSTYLHAQQQVSLMHPKTPPMQLQMQPIFFSFDFLFRNSLNLIPYWTLYNSQTLDNHRCFVSQNYKVNRSLTRLIYDCHLTPERLK